MSILGKERLCWPRSPNVGVRWHRSGTHRAFGISASSERILLAPAETRLAVGVAGGEPIEHSETQKSGLSAVGACASRSEKKCPSYSCCTFSAQIRSSHGFASRPYVIVA